MLYWYDSLISECPNADTHGLHENILSTHRVLHQYGDIFITIFAIQTCIVSRFVLLELLHTSHSLWFWGSFSSDQIYDEVTCISLIVLIKREWSFKIKKNRFSKHEFWVVLFLWDVNLWWSIIFIVVVGFKEWHFLLLREPEMYSYMTLFILRVTFLEGV